MRDNELVDLIRQCVTGKINPCEVSARMENNQLTHGQIRTALRTQLDFNIRKRNRDLVFYGCVSALLFMCFGLLITFGVIGIRIR